MLQHYSVYVYVQSETASFLVEESKLIALTVQFWKLETWEVLKVCVLDWVDIRLARVYDSATTICTKTFITYIRVTVAAYVLAADIFGTGIFR